MENNKALEKELIEETGVSQTEITKFLQESVHLKTSERNCSDGILRKSLVEQNQVRQASLDGSINSPYFCNTFLYKLVIRIWF